MNPDSNALALIQALSDAPGASGFEDAVVAIGRRYAANLGELKEDFRRNLSIYRKENTGTKPVVMLDAHSDEIGLLIHSIKPNGLLRFVQLGGWGKLTLAGTKVLVRNKHGEYVPGIIASKPVHFMTRAESTDQMLSDLAIDIGARSYDEAVNEFGIRIGEPVVPATTFEYDARRDLMFGKAFDCRIGCAAMLEALRRLEGKELPCDVVAVLSSQEEIGHKNAIITTNRVQPQAAIVLEGTPADDTFIESYAIQTALKKGPMFRHMDNSAICAPRYQRWTLDLAERLNIPVQESVREGGGNNTGYIQSTALGAPSVVCGIPVRYAHTPNCISSYFDFEAAVQLVMAMLENLTQEVIEGF